MKKLKWVVLSVALASTMTFGIFYINSKRTKINPSKPTQLIQNEQLQSKPPSATGDSFDEPLRRIDVDLGAFPYSGGDHPDHGQLRCRYYEGFMVKEMDMKEQGDEWISAIYDMNASTSCTAKHLKGELIVKDWSGYFAGARGNLIFLNGDDGYNGGYPFGVFDATTFKKLYEDSRDLDYDQILFSGQGNDLVVRYRHPEVTDCSIPEKGNECWEGIKQKTGLRSPTMPICSDYENIQDKSDPSVVSYPVELRLFPKISRKILPGLVKCWAAD